MIATQSRSCEGWFLEWNHPSRIRFALPLPPN